jgi:hypothetical protein
MGYEQDTSQENPIWRNYIEKLEEMNLEEQTKWMKEIELPPNVPFAKKSFVAYIEEDFLDKLNNDETFKERWGTL